MNLLLFSGNNVDKEEEETDCLTSQQVICDLHIGQIKFTNYFPTYWTKRPKPKLIDTQVLSADFGEGRVTKNSLNRQGCFKERDTHRGTGPGTGASQCCHFTSFVHF